jgi:hypothetical protein
MKHVVSPINTHAAARASWMLLQQLVANAIAAGDLNKASAVAAISASIDTMPDPPAAASRDAASMLEALRALIEQEGLPSD